ncbi:hypothetical protein RND71_034489 [Anisodus tanguticus]|uniref:Uncharacterized protein n=1 Tax=Anisodus tanguticus TaxID=243964 RepID=A0AAE1RAP0_9SOLA|nr:hypothetical protein RND71_034489 [Anisodus tanguticus]
MASLSGILQIPVVAAFAVAIASVSTDLHEKLRPSKSLDNCEQLNSSSALQEKKTSWVSQISVSKLADLSFVSRIRVPVPNVNVPSLSTSSSSLSGSSSSVLVNFYESAALAKSANPSTYTYTTVPSSSPSETKPPTYGNLVFKSLNTGGRTFSPKANFQHLSEPNAVVGNCSPVKSKTVVVLLGWLGAKQKHLKRYAEWYASRGYHVITFTFPMSEILSYQVGGKIEQDIEQLLNHLADWLEEEEHGKKLVFHTFILEKFQKQDHALMRRIKGCIVDSTPVAAPDPQALTMQPKYSYILDNAEVVYS